MMEDEVKCGGLGIPLLSCILFLGENEDILLFLVLFCLESSLKNPFNSGFHCEIEHKPLCNLARKCLCIIFNFHACFILSVNIVIP